MSTIESYDVVVIGGSYAGMAAALQLARARRTVLVVDAGQRRNRFASSSHGFLTQDGRSPDVIAAQAREQLLAYPTVTWRNGSATRVAPKAHGFTVHIDGDVKALARRLILATGVIDELPQLPGVQERWGRSIFHCPYCHGYELNQGRLGVLAAAPISMHQALLVPEWGAVTLFTNQAFEPDAQQLAQLQARSVVIERTPVSAIAGERAAVQLSDGREVELDGLFILARMRMGSPIAQQLGCAFEEGPLGAIIKTDAVKETTIPNVFACGDAARAMASVSLAVADGAMAGISAHQSLVMR